MKPDMVQQYQQQGWVLVSGLFSPGMLDRLELEFDAIFERRHRNKAHLDATWKGDWQEVQGHHRVVLHTHDVQAYSAAWSEVLTYEPLTACFAQCLGTENVQLHHTKAFCKPPKSGGGFPMHQDGPYFPHEKGTMMAAVIHLTDASEAMGCFRVYPGTHQLGQLPTVNDVNHYVNPQEYPVATGVALPANRGDVLFFHYLLIHGSGPNDSDRARKTVLIQVRDADDRPLIDRHVSLGQGTMLRGINPLSHGETAALGTLDGNSSGTGTRR